MHKSLFYVIFLVFLFPVLLPSAEPLAEKTQPVKPSGPTGVQKLSPTLSVDHDHDLVILEVEIVLRDAPLELLLCPKRTKEHESILAAEVEPKQFQLALLMIDAQPGRPATFQPLRPPTGQRLKIWCEYDQDGWRKLIDARQWIRNIQTKKALAANFVFAGSQFRQLPGGQRVFMANEGDLVCVANFPGAVIDIDITSNIDNAALLFEAWTERIPPEGTKIRVIIEPLDQ